MTHIPWNWKICLLIPFILEMMACQPAKIALQGGMMTKSAVIKEGYQFINTDSLSGQPYIVINEDNVEIDFGNTTIDGRQQGRLPDSYTGIAIHIRDCKNVTLRNVNIHGFKMAILAENVENLNILSSNFSYNYRPKLRSRWDREALSDWLYYHHNENDEWKEYGAAIYLKQCRNPLIKDVTCHQGFNGLLMTQCEGALIYNNDICFNSGLGIGLYRSAHNRIMHNKLDWNARGYSHGKYARGQDSSAILLYEQSSHNTIAYNSGTHSGDGLFLWAGQSTMDTGAGGCDSNMIYRNDFSHSIANGIEVTFSANYMIENNLNDCRYGIWGGYSHHSVIKGNEISRCDAGIAIEHGRYIVIDDNSINNGKTGIQLWDRTSQPEDWPYAQINNVKGRNYNIVHNEFEHISTGLDISLSDSVWLVDNLYTNVGQEVASPKGLSQFIPGANTESWANPAFELPDSLSDGMNATLAPNVLRGRKYIIVNEWGPYDFQYPLLVLRNKTYSNKSAILQFDIYGPSGTWKIDSISGCTLPDHTSGALSDSLVITCRTESQNHFLRCSFTGDTVITQFGDTIPAGVPSVFQFSETSIPMIWNISFFAYDSLSDPIKYPEAFKTLLLGNPITRLSNPQLTYRWWDAPATVLPADQFAVKATTTFDAPPGDYILEVESDDGIRIWLDDRLILDRWNIHTPTVDEVNWTALAGQHTLKVEYFEGGGLGVLDVSILKK